MNRHPKEEMIQQLEKYERIRKYRMFTKKYCSDIVRTLDDSIKGEHKQFCFDQIRRIDEACDAIVHDIKDKIMTTMP
jgi:hypothetical protein